MFSLAKYSEIVGKPLHHHIQTAMINHCAQGKDVGNLAAEEILVVHPCFAQIIIETGDIFKIIMYCIV